MAWENKLNECQSMNNASFIIKYANFVIKIEFKKLETDVILLCQDLGKKKLSLYFYFFVDEMLCLLNIYCFVF